MLEDSCVACFFVAACLPVGDGEDGRVVGSVEVLVPEPVAARPGGRPGVDAGDDGGAQHHVGGGPGGRVRKAYSALQNSIWFGMKWDESESEKGTEMETEQ